MTQKQSKLINKITTLLKEPENRKIVNEGQDYFEVILEKRDRCFHDSDIIKFVYYDLIDTRDEKHQRYEYYFDNDLPHIVKLPILMFCIKLLSAFQVATDNIIDEHVIVRVDDNGVEYPDVQPIYQTLSEALLKSGAMTVEELSKEYERLTK